MLIEPLGVQHRPLPDGHQRAQPRQPLKELGAAGKLNATEQQFLAPRRPEVEFYDTQGDPHEVVNLAAAPAQRERVARMGKLLDAWIEETNDHGRTPEPREVIEAEEPRARSAGR